MRVFKFVKIDILKVRNLIWTLLFPALAAAILLKDSSDPRALFAFLYCLLGGIVVSTTPLSEESARESGFLKMLPAGNGDAIRGHFLFSLLTMLLFGILGIAAVETSRLINPAHTVGLTCFYPLGTGAGLLIVALENALLCAFHFENAQAQGALRTIPAFVFFFGGQFLIARLPGLVTAFAAWITPARSAVLFLICVLIFWIIAEVCVILFSRRDEA